MAAKPVTTITVTHAVSGNNAQHAVVSSGPVDDDWQLISAASGSSLPSTSSHQASSRPTQHQAPHHQQIPPSRAQPQSPMKGSGDAQGFPELASLSNEALAALLVDETKYNSLVDSIMARSSVAQVGCLLQQQRIVADSAAFSITLLCALRLL